jgi:hypothetical protein
MFRTCSTLVQRLFNLRPGDVHPLFSACSTPLAPWLESSTQNQGFQTKKSGLLYLSEASARNYVSGILGKEVKRTTFFNWRKYLIEDSTTQKDPSDKNVYPIDQLDAIARFGWFVQRGATYPVAYRLMLETYTENENA